MRFILPVLMLCVAGCAGPPGPIDSALDAESRDVGVNDVGSAGDAGPVDAAPPIPRDPPPWNPPFALEPDVGWRSSTDPVCSPYAGAPNNHGAGVFADGRGVFVLESIFNNSFAGDPPFPDGVSLHFNDGTGWTTWLSLPAEPGTGGADRMTGVSNGPLFLWSGGCPLLRVDAASSSSCAFDASSLSGAFFTSVTDGYLVAGSPPSVLHVNATDSTTIGSLAEADSVTGLWADASRVLIALSDRIISSPPTGPLGPLVGVPSTTGQYSAILGDAADVWIGTFGPPTLVHFDGAVWETIDTGLAATDGVSGMWTDGTTLYFITPTTFASYTHGGGVHVLAAFPAGYLGSFVGIAGNATRGEVYVTALDIAFETYACGPTMVVVYDGTHLRRF